MRVCGYNIGVSSELIRVEKAIESNQSTILRDAKGRSLCEGTLRSQATRGHRIKEYDREVEAVVHLPFLFQIYVNCQSRLEPVALLPARPSRDDVLNLVVSLRVPVEYLEWEAKNEESCRKEKP